MSMALPDARADLANASAGPVLLGGIGHYYPGDPITNAFFEDRKELEIDDDWIRRHTGVASRHWPSDGTERHVEMAAKAASEALDDARLDATDLDLIIGTTSTARPRVNPSTVGNNYMDISLPLQDRLGARRALCFDVGAVACAGFLYGSVLARSLLWSLGIKTALVVCSENPRPILNFRYRNSALFGAGAAAAVWRRSEEESGFADAVLRSDGRHFGAFDIDESDKIVMKGKVVSALAPGMLVGAAKELLDRSGLGVEHIDWFIPHQGNINIIREVVADLNLVEDRVLLNLDVRGNTSSASIPGCLSENVRSSRVRSGDWILALSIGRGFSWGAMLFRYK